MSPTKKPVISLATAAMATLALVQWAAGASGGAARLAGIHVASTLCATDAAPVDPLVRALQDREYEKTVQLADQRLAELSHVPGDEAKAKLEELQYLRGLALLYSGKTEQSIEAFTKQLAAFPNGTWRAKARFRLAEAYTRIKDYEAAEAIYAEEVRRLVGAERKGELAKVYLRFADKFFAPSDKLTEPNFEKAYTFYDRALAVGLSEELAEEVRYNKALSLQKLGKPADAAREYRYYLTIHDPTYRQRLLGRPGSESLPEPASKPGPHRFDARLHLGECLLDLKQFTEGREILIDLIDEVTGGESRADDRDRLLEAARWEVIRSFQFPSPPTDDALFRGAKAVETYLARHRESDRAPTAAFQLAAAYTHRGRTSEALEAYQRVIDREPFAPSTDAGRETAERLVMKATFNKGQLYLGQKEYVQAIGMWNTYVAKYPTGPDWSSAQQSILNAEYQIGADLYEAKKYDEAAKAWDQFLVQHPLDGRAAETQAKIADIPYLRAEELARSSNDEQDVRPRVEALYREAIREWEKVVSKYPNSDPAGRAQFMIGQVQENELGELEPALATYRKLTWSNWKDKAQQRIARMTEVHLSIATQRVFRTNERAVVKLDTRNIDKLQVKLYRLDMEAYFRKSHTIRGVENLDIALIDPDRTWEHEVTDYTAYKPMAGDIVVETDGPGVFAVHVGNDKLEATTLLLVSDIDVVVKSSRKQVLVFAVNMRTHEAVPGATVLLSDGKEVFYEGETGKDGVLLRSDDKLKDLPMVSVFAHLDGNIASNLLNMQGLGFSTGLSQKGYVYTDRPTYRPGQLVRIRGILRAVKDGVYMVPESPEDEKLAWKLDIVGADGRLIRTETLKLSPFGSFSTGLQLSELTSTGDYKLIVRRAGGPTFDGQFSVREYQLQKVTLNFDLEKNTVFRGEKVKGKIKAEYYYGEPVARRMVEYWLGDDQRRTGVTDDKGQVTFELDTSVFSEEQAVVLRARIPDLNVQTAQTLFVAVRAYRASVSVVRDLYLSDETFDVTINTNDLEAKPISRSMSVTALRRERSEGQWHEVKVDTRDLTTDAKTGQGRVSFNLTQGGQYVLRAEGKDRFGNVITASTNVTISDADDATKVRIISDKQHYRVGDKLEATLHSRLEPELALITFEGETILSYRIVTLQPGRNPLELSIGNEHFPNFTASVAVMVDRPKDDPTGPGRFHTASREFQVSRQLRITLTPDKQEYQPRDKVTLKVKTTDQQGKPVAAEVGVAMIDQALLTLFPDQTPSIVDFFQAGVRRESAMRTTATNTFRYAAKTRAVSEAVLAEQRRMRKLEEAGEAAAIRGGSLAGVALQPETETTLLHLAAPATARAEGEGRDGKRLRSSSYGYALGRRVGAPANQPDDAAAAMPADAVPLEIAGEDFGALDGRLMFAFPSQGQAEGWARGADRAYSVTFRDRDGDGQPEVLVVAGDAEVPVDLPSLGLVDALNEGIASNSLIISGNAQMYVPALQAKLDEAIQDLPTRSYFPEVGYWNPAVVTNEKGEATVEFVLPDSTTTWKFLARGITEESLPGQSEASIVTRQDFFVELSPPPLLMEGDAVRLTAKVHQHTDFRGDILATLKTTVGDQSKEYVKQVTSEGKGVLSTPFERVEIALPKEGPAEITFELSAVAGDAHDVLTRTSPIRPWGMEYADSKAGMARDSQSIELELPPGQDYTDRKLTIQIGPTAQRMLIDAALGGNQPVGGSAAMLRSLCSFAPPPVDTNAAAASDLLAVAYVMDYLQTTANEGGPDHRQLADRAAGLISRLVVAQRDDGGWSWAGKQADADDYTSSQVVWALAKADRVGLRVPEKTLEQAKAFLSSQFANARPADNERKAVLLHGLSWVGGADFAWANRLYRMRPSLNTSALAYLALAMIQLDRKSIAGELVTELLSRPADAGEVATRSGSRMARISVKGNDAWMRSDTEITALTLLALEQTDPSHERVRPMVEELVSARRGGVWSPAKAKGAVVAALATFHVEVEPAAADYTLTVMVNGKDVRKLVVADKPTTAYIDVPADTLNGGKEKVDLQLAGRGEYTYVATLSGFGKEFRVTEKQERFRTHDRRYAPPPLEYKGRPVSAGFSVARNYQHFTNEVTQLNVGKVTTVRVEPYRMRAHDAGPGDLDYLVFEEAIPAGMNVLGDTVQGNFDTFRIENGRLVFYFGPRRNLGPITYQLVAQTPGTYRVPPTIIRSLYSPELMHMNNGTTFTVLARRQRSKDKYRYTPDERFELGKLNYQDGQYPEARNHLTALFDAWDLNDEPYKETARMLLYVSLAEDNAKDVVKYFEILKERYPDLVIPFGEILRIGEAYCSLDEFERAYLVYRATADASFVRDAKIAGTLREEGQFLASIDFLHDLWGEYPDLPQVESMLFALSQSLYGQSNNAGSLTPREPERGGRERSTTKASARITKRDVIREVITLLNQFLTLYPESPLADQAAYSLSNATVELAEYDQAIKLCQQFVERFADSQYVDRFQYIQSLAHFNLDQYEAAIRLADAVAKATFKDAQGVTQPSENKWLALYIIGQIHDARGNPAKAIEYYRQVRERFSDAAEAVDYFTEKRLSMPEVTVFHPAAAGFYEQDALHEAYTEYAKGGGSRVSANGTNGLLAWVERAPVADSPSIRLNFRNIKEAHVQVYRVDLMKLYLLEKNLSAITSVNLAGIKPAQVSTVALGDGKDYIDKARVLKLDIAQEGAYLVICRGDQLFTSGLVMITPMRIEVQEEPSAGRLRVHVVDALTRAPVKRVHVKTIGSSNSEFVTGETDLRGIFIADGIFGRPTTIARDATNVYAFHRGTRSIGAPPKAKQPEGGVEAGPKAAPQAVHEYFENISRENIKMQGTNEAVIQRLFKQDQQGVQVQQAE